MSKRIPQLDLAIGKSIKPRRVLEGITQQRLAELSDISPTHMSDIERGLSNISVSTLTMIALGLGMKDPGLLFQDDDVQSVLKNLRDKRK